MHSSLACAAATPSARQKQVSNLDVELPKGCNDKEYMRHLRWHLPRLLDQLQPSLVYYQAGVDIFVGDRLGKMDISRCVRIGCDGCSAVCLNASICTVPQPLKWCLAHPTSLPKTQTVFLSNNPMGSS